jgi:WD40 repeat protein
MFKFVGNRSYTLLILTPLLAWPIPNLINLEKHREGNGLTQPQFFQQTGESNLANACLSEGGHTSPVNAIATGGNILVSGGDDKTIRIWDLQTQQKIFASEPQSEWIQRLVITSDGKIAVAQDYSDKITIWDVESQQISFSIEPVEDRWKTTALAVSSDGKLLAIANLQTITIWDLEERRKIRTIEQGTYWEAGEGSGIFSADAVTFLKISADRKKLYSGGSVLNQIVLKVWNLETGEELSSIQEFTPDTSQISNVYVTADETHVVVEDFGNFVSIQNLLTRNRIEIPIKNSPNYVYSFATFLDFHTQLENQALIGVSRQGIFVWNLATGELRKSLLVRDFEIQSSTLSPHEKTLILGAADGSIQQLELESGRWLNQFPSGCL